MKGDGSQVNRPKRACYAIHTENVPQKAYSHLLLLSDPSLYAFKRLTTQEGKLPK